MRLCVVCVLFCGPEGPPTRVQLKKEEIIAGAVIPSDYPLRGGGLPATALQPRSPWTTAVVFVTHSGPDMQSSASSQLFKIDLDLMGWQMLKLLTAIPVRRVSASWDLYCNGRI
ncbi:unnamed protein product [Lota lota]